MWEVLIVLMVLFQMRYANCILISTLRHSMHAQIFMHALNSYSKM